MTVSKITSEYRYVLGNLARARVALLLYFIPIWTTIATDLKITAWPVRLPSASYRLRIQISL